MIPERNGIVTFLQQSKVLLHHSNNFQEQMGPYRGCEGNLGMFTCAILNSAARRNCACRLRWAGLASHQASNCVDVSVSWKACETAYKVQEKLVQTVSQYGKKTAKMLDWSVSGR